MAAEPQDAEQRRILRDLKQQGQSALTWGLPNPATEASLIGVGLLLRERLADRADVTGASKAAAIAAQLIDKTTARMPAAGSFACRAGCSFCCHTAVGVSAPEALRIVRALTESAAEDGGAPPVLGRDEVLARCKAASAAALDEIVKRHAPCAFLAGDNCAVHDVRPMNCRQYYSTSVADCEAALAGTSDAFPFVKGAVNIGVMARSLLLGAAQSLGLPSDHYELASALVIALEAGDAEQRWLAGEDMFAGAIKLPRATQMQTSIERWSPMLKTFAEGV